MQTVMNTASTVAETATNLASSAAAAVGLTSEPHSEEHGHRSELPPDSSATKVIKMDTDGLQVFEDEGVRHEVLVKINKLAKEDAKHGLKEVAALDLVVDGEVKKGISYYHPLRYFTVIRPMGIEYFGEIEIEQARSIHVRCHRASAGSKPTFHSLDTRRGDEGGAVFATGEALWWFDY